MSEFDRLLDGVEAALELERELGVKSFPFDRSLLAPPTPVGKEIEKIEKAEKTETLVTVGTLGTVGTSGTAGHRTCQVVFLHDRPLSEGGADIMAKIANKLGWTPETAPIVLAPPLPEARVRVVLGWRTLKKFYPGMHGEPGQWLKSPDGADVLVTYSPDYFMRFDQTLPAIREKKMEMWRSIKGAKQRIER